MDNEAKRIAEGERLRWADMQNNPEAIVNCGDLWKLVAASIGCTLHGFDDDFHASFLTPDGNVIEIGPKFRTYLEQKQ